MTTTTMCPIATPSSTHLAALPASAEGADTLLDPHGAAFSIMQPAS